MRDDTIPVPGAADRAVAYGDLTDDLLRTDWWTDAMLARGRHPGRRRPVRVRRRRHRLLRHGRLPAHRGRADLGDPGAVQHRPPVADLRVPDPRLADPARRADPVGLGVAPGQHLGLPVATRCARRGATGRCEPLRARARASRSSPTTGRRRPGTVFDVAGAGVRTGSATRRCSSRASVRMVRRRIGGGYFTILTPPAGTAPHQAGGVPRRASCTSPSATPGCGSCPTCRTFRETHRDFEQRGQRLRAARARSTSGCKTRRAPCSSAAAASSPRACCSG